MDITNELLIFLKTIILGMGIGIIFDIFRIIRKIIPHKDFLVLLQDFLFCFFTGIYFFILIYYLNFGQIRFYMIIGIIISNLFYLLLFSKPFMNICLFIFKPINILFVKIRQKMKQFYKNT